MKIQNDITITPFEELGVLKQLINHDTVVVINVAIELLYSAVEVQQIELLWNP